MRAVVACVLFLSAVRASASPCRKIDGEDALLAPNRVVLRALGKKVHPFTFGGAGPRYEDAIPAARHPARVMLALMGNAHAAVLRDADDDADPVGLALRKAGIDVRSIWVDFTRGAAYNRGADGAGVHAQVGTGSKMKPYALERSKDPHYDLAISIGEMHPSPPAGP